MGYDDIVTTIHHLVFCYLFNDGILVSWWFIVFDVLQDTVTVHTKIRPKDVPGTLLNVVSKPYCVHSQYLFFYNWFILAQR